MNTNYLKYLLASLFVILIIGVNYNLYSNLEQSSNDVYLSMVILNYDNFMGEYFDDGNMVGVGTEIRWNILLENLGYSKYVKLKVLLGGSIDDLPDQLNFESSPSPVLLEIYKIVERDGKAFIPFIWSVDSYELDNIMININGYEVSTSISPENEGEFFLVFELWVYDMEGNFIFKWISRGEPHCIWNSIKFMII